MLHFRQYLLLLLTLLPVTEVFAQKQFNEGTVIYDVQLEGNDNQMVKGTFVLTVKNGRLRKQIKLENGFIYDLIIDCISNKVYSLKEASNKSYAIQLDMNDLFLKQQPFEQFRLEEDRKDKKTIGGITAYHGTVRYKDGKTSDIYYTNEWKPERKVTFERFPDALFFPLAYTFEDAAGSLMRMEVKSISASPVSEGVFRLPGDLMMISRDEFRKLR